MILIDPELKSTGRGGIAPRLQTKSSAGSGPPRRERLPAARTLEDFLHVAQKAVRLRGEVTVFVTTDKTIRKLNGQFRGLDKATDVLSFPAGGPASAETAGDLAISSQTALRQAREQGHSLSVEIKVLMLHGLLHLAGFDHETDDGQMARRERLLRARLGLPQGLIERAVASDSAPKRAKASLARGGRG
ncbi:MAG TPA: rRNA maturation RNase YbeY [Terracidiphilus sp.]|nr:rRNA maturation RNase YbeY [Terracidiphilus sp.]